MTKRYSLIYADPPWSYRDKAAGQQVLSLLGYYSKFEHLVRELMHREILQSEAQTLEELRDHIADLSEKLGKAIDL